MREKHFGKEVWLSRKGAIDAGEGVRGLIPGSMGAASYVVTGKGNRLALNSSPHGAGRNHSRSAAKKLFTRADLDKRMAGIAWGESDAFLDERGDATRLLHSGRHCRVRCASLVTSWGVFADPTSCSPPFPGTGGVCISTGRAHAAEARNGWA